MNILLIGNGFDLAHDLPTKYKDFLDFTKLFLDCYEGVKSGQIDWVFYDTNDKTKAFLRKWFSSWYQNENGQSEKEKKATVKITEEFKENIEDNLWIEYFWQIYSDRIKVGKDGWIDFESEISRIIKELDDDMRLSISQRFTLEDKIQHISNNFLNQKYIDWFSKRTYKELRDKLSEDLIKLIRALEIYLCEYVEKIEIKKKSPDIEELNIDHVLSFNYTHTFSWLYNREGIEKTDSDKFDYIHGEANIENSIESNNMVLGIDEYLFDNRKNKDIEFIAFKKYYQRIHKQTGCKYKEWVDEIRQDYFDHLQKIEDAKYKELQYIPDKMQRILNRHTLSAIKGEKCQVHNLYIFGHSLDETDKDVLRDLILNDNVKTTIFYLNKDVMGQQIANLVKVIEQDELIRRTGGSTKTIEFKLQQDMVTIKK